MIFVKYVLSVPKEEEKEFHPIVKKCSKQIFGEDSIYFDVKHTIKTVSGIGSIPDAYVINLAINEWYVVENELSSHPIYDHIVKQLTKFINGIENPVARNEIIDILYDEINRDVELRAKIQKKIGSKDIHHFLSKLISKDPRIVIVIDQKTRETEEACRALKYQPDIIELKTYVREDAPAVHAYLIEPLYTFKKTESEEEKRRAIPEHYKSWDKMLQWVNDNVREMVALLTDRITQLGDVNHVAHGKYYCFYRGKPSTRSIFAAFILTKKALHVRIRVNPSTFKDPQNWTKNKVYKGWFFKRYGQERGFKMTSKEQIDYAIELIKQSYDLAKGLS